MSLPEYNVRSEYIGNGLLSDYTFDFKLPALEDLLIVCVDDQFEEVFRVRGDDDTFLTSVDFDPDEAGGEIHLVDPLPTDYRLAIILADDDPIQESEFRNKQDFTLKRIEDALDNLAGGLQRVVYRAKRSVKLPEWMLDSEVDAFDVEVPNPFGNAGKVLAINFDEDGFVLTDNAATLIFGTEPPVDSDGSNGQFFLDRTNMLLYGPKTDGEWPLPGIPLAGGGNLPPGGDAGAALVKQTAATGDAIWEPFVYEGFSSRFGAWASQGLKDTIDQILDMVRLGPTISLVATGSGTVREKGDTVASTTLTATVTKFSDPIQEVRFYESPATLLDTQTGDPPVPDGGDADYDYLTPFDDNISFFARVDDDGSTNGGTPTTVQSNTVSFVFVYPYYYGAGAAALTAAQVALLTKDIIVSTASVQKTFNPTGGQVLYFAYPASYGVLTSILDSNDFETIGDWTLRVENITGLDGNPVSYNIYEFNNPLVAGSYEYTFIR